MTTEERVRRLEQEGRWTGIRSSNQGEAKVGTVAAVAVVLFLSAAAGGCERCTERSPESPAILQALVEEFNRIDEAMHRILLPNSMARLTPRTQAEIDGHMETINAGVRVFRQYYTPGICFLKGVLVGTPSSEDSKYDDDYRGQVALQILCMLDTRLAKECIREARTHVNKMVASRARWMFDGQGDLLSGYRQ